MGLLCLDKRERPYCGLLIYNRSLLEAWKETLPSTDRTRGNGFKLNEARFILGIRETFFTMMVVEQVVQRSCGSSSLEVFCDSMNCNSSHEVQVSLVLKLLTDLLHSGMSACTELLVIPNFPHCKRKELSKACVPALSVPLHAGTCPQ